MSARLFLLSAKLGFDSVAFAEKLMQSRWGDYLYSQTCVDAWLGEPYVMETLIYEEGKPPKGKILPEPILEWVGYLYRYWSLNYPETGKEIYRIAPISLLAQGYMGWHCMSLDLVIEDLKDIAAGKYEDKR